MTGKYPRNGGVHAENHLWLVVEPTPLKNMSSSVGMMKFPIYGKKHVPNQQPDFTAFKNCQNPMLARVC